MSGQQVYLWELLEYVEPMAPDDAVIMIHQTWKVLKFLVDEGTILRFSISFIYKYIYSNLIVNYIFIYKQKVVENQCFIFGFCFIDLPRYQLIPG